MKIIYLKLQNTQYSNKVKTALISSCSIKLAIKAGRLADYWLQASNTIQEINCTFYEVITTKSVGSQFFRLITVSHIWR